MSVWQLEGQWAGWICPVPYGLASLPSACLLPAADSPHALCQLVCLSSLWINYICNTICTRAAKPPSESLRINFSVLWGTGATESPLLSGLRDTVQGLFILSPFLWHARVIYPSFLPVTSQMNMHVSSWTVFIPTGEPFWKDCCR